MFSTDQSRPRRCLLSGKRGVPENIWHVAFATLIMCLVKLSRLKFRQENPPVTPKMRSPGRRAKDWGAPGSAFSTDSLDADDGGSAAGKPERRL